MPHQNSPNCISGLLHVQHFPGGRRWACPLDPPRGSSPLATHLAPFTQPIKQIFQFISISNYNPKKKCRWSSSLLSISTTSHLVAMWTLKVITSHLRRYYRSHSSELLNDCSPWWWGYKSTTSPYIMKGAQTLIFPICWHDPTCHSKAKKKMKSALWITLSQWSVMRYQHDRGRSGPAPA